MGSDRTSRANLILYGLAASSARGWTEGKTVLLLSFPVLKISVQNRVLELGDETMVDVEPDMEEATSLKEWAYRPRKQQKTIHEAVKSGESSV